VGSRRNSDEGTCEVKKGPGDATENHEKSRYYGSIPSLTTPHLVIPLVKVIVKGVASWHIRDFHISWDVGIW
jgi:hypothetical protein